MNLAKAFGGGYPTSTIGTLQSWESQEGAHTPSGSKTPIVICGWLLKMKREHRKFRSTWNRRWFTVEDGAFHWYKTSSSDACGRLSLMDISSVSKFVGAGHGGFTFVIRAADRDMLLRADSANDESRWVRGLTLQIDLVHGGTFQGPPSVKNRRRSVSRMMGCGEGGRGHERRRGGGGGGGDGRGRGGREGGGESKEQLDGEWEGNQFREIHDRIRAIMDDRHGSLDPAASSEAISQAGSETTRHSVPRAPPVPRDPRGISIVGGRSLAKSLEKGGGGGDGSASASGGGDGGDDGGGGGSGGSGDRGTDARWGRFSSSRVVPILEPESCSFESGRKDEKRADIGGEDGRWSVSPAMDGGGSGGGGRGGGGGSGGGGGGGGGSTRRASHPPMPRGPPPANVRGRSGSSWTKTSSTPAAIERLEIVDVLNGSDYNEGFDDYRGRHGGGDDVSNRSTPVADNGRRGSKQRRRRVGSRGGGESKYGGGPKGARRWETDRAGSAQARREGGGGERKDSQRFDDLEGLSSDESVRTRDELFADDFSPINTARSSASSQYSGAGRPPSGHDRKQKQNPKQQQQPQQRQQHQQHQQQQQQQQQKRNQQRNQQQLHQQKSRVTDDDDESESDSDGDTTPLSSPCREQSARNFDDDDSSKEEVSVDEMNFWPQSGYADGNGGGGGCGYPRGSSGGSATVEDSWNTGMGRALDDDTPSNSRIGSSGRSSSRSSVRKPSRRYLVEQNRLREGW